MGRPVMSDPAVAEDLRRLTLSFRTEVTTGVAARLPESTSPRLSRGRQMTCSSKRGDGERLAATIPNARVEIIEGARTFSMVDQPDRLAELISTFARVAHVADQRTPHAEHSLSGYGF